MKKDCKIQWFLGVQFGISVLLFALIFYKFEHQKKREKELIAHFGPMVNQMRAAVNKRPVEIGSFEELGDAYFRVFSDLFSTSQNPPDGNKE